MRGNYFLKYTIEGRIEGRLLVAGRRGRRSKHVLDGLKKQEVTIN
jgi:hypothetical protein